MLDINFFQSLAEYANENWKGSFTPEEVREYAEIYFSDFKISLENGKETETISSLIKNLKEDSDNGISEAEEFLGKLHYEKYCRNFNEIHRRNEKEVLVSVDGM